MKSFASLALPAFFPAQAFALPGLLPPQTCLLLDLRTSTALLLHLDAAGTTPLVCAYRLKPSAARVFLALLQVYPRCCEYPHLFTMLYATVDEVHRPTWDPVIGLRPIRRALFALAPALRFFGLETVAMRKRGYVLAAASPAEAMGQEPSAQSREVPPSC